MFLSYGIPLDGVFKIQKNFSMRFLAQKRVEKFFWILNTKPIRVRHWLSPPACKSQ